MNIPVGRLCTFALISLLSLLGFAAQSNARDNTLNQLAGSPRRAGSARNTHKASDLGAQSSPFSVLYSFCSAPKCADGSYPLGDLIQDSAGNLYGTTLVGGSNYICNGFEAGCGTIFKVDVTGSETVLYTFCPGGNPCTDGAEPQTGVVQDAAGNLYGTTWLGGNVDYDTGTVFKVDNTGHETVLYTFCPGGKPCADGENPAAGVIRDGAGNLYGTTYGGGANGGGAVFKLDSTGHYTVLHSFCAAQNCTDGQQPTAGVILDAAGNMYGTTSTGGAYDRGTVFKVDSLGQETVLYSFCPGGFPCSDGFPPSFGSLIRDVAGNLYGTTYDAGQNAGKVFRLDNTGHYTVLYSFCSFPNCTDGGGPTGSLIQDAAGDIYGTASIGGANGGGAVFKLDSTGHYTVLHSFCAAQNCTDGEEPNAGVILDAAGNMYGTTSTGGANGGGTVFKLGTAASETATVKITSTPNPSYVAQPVTLTVVASGSGATPTGTVTFVEGKTILGTGPLVDGLASFTTTFAKSGNLSIVGMYSGDENYKSKNSKPLRQVVNLYATSTTLASSLNPSNYGQPVSFAVTVASAGPTPTGKVRFLDGATGIGVVVLSNGVATLTKSKLAVGTHPITAQYLGDVANSGSTSSVLYQVVQ